MFQNKNSLAVAAAFALTLAGCGGNGGPGDSATKIQFSSQVVFGDSLSDVGSYAVGNIVALGGGRYTINSNVNGLPAKTNWTELMAATLNQTAPCAAETGLAGSALYGFSVPIAFHTGCTNYAMGGSMVTYPFGPGNANVGAIPTGNPVDGSAILGQLTVPVVTQIQNHLTAVGGAFSGREVVFVLAGGNDGIFNSLLFLGSVQAAAVGGAAAAAAEAAIAGPAAVQAMGVAGAQLAGYVNNLILAKGAKYVVVLNLPDLSTTPFGTQVDAALPGTKALISTMVHTFNSQLQAGLTSPDVLLVDAYTVSVEQITNPSIFGLTNVTDVACNLNSSVNLLSSSLVCNGSNVIAGDISHYEFADQVHPTPFGNVLLARYVASRMAIKGWL